MSLAFEERRGRIGALTVALAGLFGVVTLRLVALVEFEGEQLSSLAQSEHSTDVQMEAVRGPIVDRLGKALALSAETRSVYARPAKLIASSTAGDRARLAAFMGMPQDELARRLQHKSSFVWLARHTAVSEALAAQGLGLDGIGVVSEYKRFYPEGNLAAGVVGLAGMDGQGLSGLELEYDKLVRGKPVVLRLYHDALRHSIIDSPLALKNPEPGARLVLTIDSTIQSLAQSLLEAEVRRLRASHASAVVLNPFTGEVLALANVKASRLRNAAVQDTFEPGSTLKGILAAIALEDGVLRPGEKLYCGDGQLIVDGHTIHDHGAHDYLDLGGIIEVSSNVGAASIALMLGSQRYYEGLRSFGIGHRTGLDLPGEAAGVLRKPATWRQLDLATLGFGQGAALTPIQLAVAYAAIANGGLIMRPYVVRGAYDAAGRPLLIHDPQVVRRAVSPAVAHEVNRLLRQVVNGQDGTGRLAKIDDFVVAGKTGTAQVADPVRRAYFRDRLVASFVGFVPADEPRLVILVVLYDVGHGHFGGMVAAPVFREIAAGALRHLNVASKRSSYDVASLLPAWADGVTSPKTGKAPDAALRAPSLKTSTMGDVTPDFSGLSLRRALSVARPKRLNLLVRGEGYVVDQQPAPGAPLSRSPLLLRLAPIGGEAAARPLRLAKDFRRGFRGRSAEEGRGGR